MAIVHFFLSSCSASNGVSHKGAYIVQTAMLSETIFNIAKMKRAKALRNDTINVINHDITIPAVSKIVVLDGTSA